MTEIAERLERQAVNVENDGHVSAARAMRDAAQALTEARVEIERLKASIDRVARVDNSLAKQLRASIENNAALVNELSTLRARVREVVGPFGKAGDLFGSSQPDSYDEDIYSPAAGDEYSLRGSHLRAARQLMEDLKDA